MILHGIVLTIFAEYEKRKYQKKSLNRYFMLIAKQLFVSRHKSFQEATLGLKAHQVVIKKKNWRGIVIARGLTLNETI